MQSATITPKIHVYFEPLLEIRRQRLPWGPRHRVSVHIQKEAGSHKGPTNGPYQRLRSNPWCKCSTRADLPQVSTGLLQRLYREAVAWKHLQHPNILPLLGVTTLGGQFAMVSEWMEDGNINEFIQKNPDADRTELVRILFGLRGTSIDFFSSLTSRRVWRICTVFTLSTEI